MERPQLTDEQQAAFDVLVHLLNELNEDLRARQRAEWALNDAKRTAEASTKRYETVYVLLCHQHPGVDWSDVLEWEAAS